MHVCVLMDVGIQTVLLMFLLPLRGQCGLKCIWTCYQDKKQSNLAFAFSLSHYNPFFGFDYCVVISAGGTIDRPGGGSAESSPYFSRRHHKPFERYQSCMTLPSEGLVDPLDRVRGRARAEGEERGMGTGSSGPASPRSVNSAPCGLEDRNSSTSQLGLALPLSLTHSSPTASPQRMEWKVNNVTELIIRKRSPVSQAKFCR